MSIYRRKSRGDDTDSWMWRGGRLPAWQLSLAGLISHYRYRGQHHLNHPGAEGVEEIAEAIRSEVRVVGRLGGWDIVEQNGQQYFRTETSFAAATWPTDDVPGVYIKMDDTALANLPALLPSHDTCGDVHE